MRLTRRALTATVVTACVALGALGPVGPAAATGGSPHGNGTSPASAASGTPDDSGSEDATADTGPRSGELIAAIEPITGVRPTSTTVIGGAILNQTGEPTEVTVRIGGLPEGTAVAVVRPDRDHPDPPDPLTPGGAATAWSCEELTCRLVGPDGAPASIPPGAGARLVVGLTGDRLTSGTEASVTVGDAAPRTVPLDRPDHEPAMGDESLSLSASGSTSIAPGTTGRLNITVADIGTTATAAGSLVVDVPAPAIAGSTVTASGSGWTCTARSCSTAAALQPWDAAPPLTLTTTVPADATGDGELRLSARATSAAGTGLTATTTVDQAARPPETHDVSVRIDRLAQPSLSAPTTQDVPVVVTATGHSADGTALYDQVAVTLEVERDVTVDWDSAHSTGPWRCSAEDERCVSSAPLVAGQPSTIRIPVTYRTGVREGTSKIRAMATTDPTTRTGAVPADGVERAARSDSMTATVVVNPPPAPELRSRLTSAAAATDLPGAALTFAIGQERPLTVEVTNHGSRAALAGSVVEVALSPDIEQSVVRAGGDGWRCVGFAATGDRDGDPYGVDADTPLRCRTTLTSDLVPDATSEVPITLAGSEPGSSRWTVSSTLDRRRAPGDAPVFTVDVDSDVPDLVPRLEVDHGLVRDGVGSVQVTLANHGLADADGGVLVLDLPAGVGVREAAGDGWTCPDTAIEAARANLTCATTAVVAPGAESSPVRLELTVAADAALESPADLGTAVADEGADSDSISKDSADSDPEPLPTVDVWMWATAPGQDHPVARRAGTTVSLPVHPEESVDAGDDLTVVTPVVGADGVARPATVLLRGEATGSLARDVHWSQLCTAEGQPDCDGVSPAVTWLGVPEGQDPTTAVARFTAPEIDGPTTLRFRLTASNADPSNSTASFERSSDVEVHLVPAASTGTGSRSSTSGAATDGNAGAGAGADGTSGTGPTAPDVVSASIGDGSTLQVATRTTAVLAATAGGTAPFTWSWEQTSGPDATVLDGTTSSELAFTAPSLEPDQTDQELGFTVTVTDALGNTATADATVDVVWGDDGLLVSLADGAAAVDAQVQGPVTITSQVSSAGSPYTYRWSFSGGDLELPSGTPTDDPTLSFTAPEEPGETTVELEVTDSFGRVTVATVPLEVTELPAGEVPAALCDALAALSTGEPGGLATADGSVRVAIPTATVDDVPAPAPSTSTTTSSTTTPSTTTSSTTPSSSTTTSTTPAATCAGSSTATFTDAAVELPGGISLTAASGELSIVGVLIDSATIAVPTNWGSLSFEVPADGLLLPFVSSTAIGLPLGSLNGTGIPFTAPDGWAGTTTVTFPSSGAPHAAVDAVAEPTGSGVDGHLSLTGAATESGAAQLEMRATGLVGMGPVDIPLAGALSTSDPTSAVTSTVVGAVAGPVPLSTDVSIADVSLTWSPSAASGRASLLLGTTGAPLSVLTGVSVRGGIGADVDLAVGFPATTWAPGGPTGPQFALSGNGSLSAGSPAQLDLQVRGPAAATWSPTPSLQLERLTPSVSIDCPLGPTTQCRPTASVAGSATVASPVGTGQPASVTGSLDMATGVTSLTAAPGDLTVAPLSVTTTQLTVELSPATPADAGGSVVPTATGSTSVLGSSRSATVTFTPTAVVVAAELDGLEPIPGWVLQDTVAVATSADSTYQFAGQQPFAVTAGSLTGAATTTMPSGLTEGVLPPSVTSGTITFPITATAASPTAFTLDVGAPNGWYLLGSDGGQEPAPDASTLSIETISYAIAVAGQAVTVTPSGTATMTLPAIADTVPGAAPPLRFTGSLAPGSDGGVLQLDLQATVPTWSNPFGVTGLTLSAAQVQATTTAAGTQATLSATATLDPVLSAVLGTPAGAAPTLTAPLAPSGSVCPSIDLQDIGVDLGGIGLLQASTARLELQPAGCSPAKGQAISTGFGVSFSGKYLGSATAAIQPTTSAIDDQIVLSDAQIDGLSLSDTTVSVTTELPTQIAALPQLSMVVSGSAQVAGQDVSLTGAVAAPSATQSSATIDLVSDPISITIPGSTGSAGDDEGLVVDTAGLGVSVAATAGTGTPSIVLAGTTEVLGLTDVGVWLSGSATDSEITELNGCVTGAGGVAPDATTPDPCATVQPTTFPLVVSGDTLSTTVMISYVASRSQPLSLTTPKGGATLVANGFTFRSGTVALTSQGFTIDTTIATPGSTNVPVALTGDYVVDPGAGDGSAGDFTLATPSATELDFSGFEASGQAVFSRSDGVAHSKITASVAPGLFDQDTTVKLTGDIAADGTSKLSGSADDVTFRGLSGSATFTVTPGTQSGDPTTQALGLKGWYQTQVSFTTDQDQCDLWKGPPPVLHGTVYRSGPVTYYTLTGSTKLVMPDGFELITHDKQPLTLSNEWIGGVDGQPAAGITASKQWHTATFTAVGVVSIQPAQCSYGVSATAVFGFDQGAQAAQLHGAMTPPTGISYQSGGLWGTGGSLPPDIEVTRTALEWSALNAALTAAQARATAFNDAAQQRLDDWTTAAANAQERLNQARSDVQAAEQRLATAKAAAQSAASELARARVAGDQDAADYAEESQYDAQDELVAAEADLQGAQASAQTAAATATANQADLEDATAQAAAAETALDDASAQSKQSSTAKMVTIDFTHCETCSPVDTFSFGGEMFFDVYFVVGVDLTIGFDENAFDTIQGSITFGVQKQFAYGSSYIGVYASATGTIELTVGYNFNGEGWTQLDVGIDIQANLSAYLSAYFFSYTATLLAVDITASIDFLPPPISWQGSVSLDLWGYTVRAGFGPESMSK